MRIFEAFAIAVNRINDIVGRLGIEILRDDQHRLGPECADVRWEGWVGIGRNVDFKKCGMIVDQFFNIVVVHAEQIGLTELEQLLQGRIRVHADVHHRLDRAVTKCHRVL